MSDKKDSSDIFDLGEELSSSKEDSPANKKPQGKPEGLSGAHEANSSPDGDGTSASEAQKKISDLERELLYLRAEFDNYRKQAIKERSDLSRYAGERLARDLLNVLDIFEKALDSEITADSLANFQKGVEMTQREFKSILEQHGIRELKAMGEAFDPHVHEAIGSEPRQDLPEGHVAQVLKKPFKYHDRILRVGQVIVASRPQSSSEEGPSS